MIAFNRADFHTGLFARRAALLIPIGCIGTQVAFRRFSFRWIPNCAMGSLGTGGKASLAADAFRFINHPDVAIGGIYVAGARGAILNTERRDALPAYRHGNVVRVFGE